MDDGEGMMQSLRYAPLPNSVALNLKRRIAGLR